MSRYDYPRHIYYQKARELTYKNGKPRRYSLDTWYMASVLSWQYFVEVS